MKDIKQMLQHVADLCTEADSHRQLGEIGASHMTSVLDLLAVDPDVLGRSAVSRLDVWSVCRTLNSAADNHQRFVDGGGVQMAFADLDTSNYRDQSVHVVVLLTLYEISFTHGSELVHSRYLSKLLELLTSRLQATSYSSAQVLACLLHKGHLDRSVHNINTNTITAEMSEAIARWSLNYRPIVDMQHFNIQADYLTTDKYGVLTELASWQLCHYTLADLDTYGYMVARDVSTALLRAAVQDGNTTQCARHWMQQVVRRCLSTRGLAEYVEIKTFFKSLLKEAEVCFDNQDRSGLCQIAQRHLPSALRYLSVISSGDPSPEADQSDDCICPDTVSQSDDSGSSLDDDSQSPTSKQSARDNQSEARILQVTTADEGERACLRPDRASETRKCSHDDNAKYDDQTRQAGLISLNTPSARKTYLSDLAEDAWKLSYMITWCCNYNEIFVDGGGVSLTRMYLSDPDQSGITLTYVLWTLYNVSYTNPESVVRPWLIADLMLLLRHKNQNISFVSCQILASLLHGHRTQWYEGHPDTNTLTEAMMNAIDSWQINLDCEVCTHDIVLVDKCRYLSSGHLPVLQYFMAWQLSYHLRRDPGSRLLTEADLFRIQEITDSDRTDSRLRTILAHVMEACNKRETRPWYAKTKNTLKLILKAVEASWKANDRKELVLQCKHYLTTLLAILDKDQTSEDLASDVWQIFYYLTWAGGCHKYFVGGGCLTPTFASLRRWKHADVIAENILMTLYFVARTHSKSFLRKSYLQQLLDILHSPVQRISYISCQLLARLLHKSAARWQNECEPMRQQIADNIEKAIDSWSLNSTLSINFDVRHVAYLTDASHPVLRYVMAWVLRACVHNDPTEYCTLIVRHVGMKLLNDTITDHVTSDKVGVLLTQVIKCCHEQAELAGYINMQNTLQSDHHHDDQSPDDRANMTAVLRFLESASSMGTPVELVEHGWQICEQLVRDGHEEAFVTGSGLRTALTALRQHDAAGGLIQYAADVLLHVIDSDPELLLRPAYLDTLLDLLLGQIQKVSYHSCRILCRVLHRAPKHWCQETSTKDDVISQMSHVISQWTFDDDMGTRVECFRVQREYLVSRQPVLQKMAVWDLCYYTSRDSSYYRVLARDVGLTVLKQVRDSVVLDKTITTSIRKLVSYCEGKEDLRLYILEKDALRTVLEKTKLCLSEADKTGMAKIGSEHLSEVLATLASPRTAHLPQDIIDDAWTLCDMLTAVPYVNYQLFVNTGGLLIAFKCLQQYAGWADIENRILSILYRAALRNAFAFLRATYLDKLVDLLWNSDGTTSFLACRLLARILHNGSGDWDIIRPSPDEVALQMSDRIDRWPTTCQLYFSPDNLDMEELVSFLSAIEQPVLQYFAAWQLCSLICSDPDTYVKLIVNNIGIERLLAVADSIQADEKVKVMLNSVVRYCQRLESYLQNDGHHVEIILVQSP